MLAREEIQIIEQAQIEIKGNLVDNYEDFIKFGAKSKLPEDRIIEVLLDMEIQRDIQNLLWYKKYIFKCPDCKKNGRTYRSCEFCVKEYLEKQFDKQKSENEELNKEIRKAQEEVPYPILLTEWIPYEEMTNIEPLVIEKGVYSAVWKKGIPYDFQENQIIRIENTNVILKELQEDMDFENEISIHIKAKTTGFGAVPCYGITYNGNRVNSYMLVLKPMRQTLDDYLEENHPLPPYEIDNLLWTLSTRLFNLHKDGIIHKDLHPGNYMKGNNNEWILIDFGFSGETKNDSIPTDPGEYSKKTDIRDFGEIMCQAITGALPERDSRHDYIIPNNLEIDYKQIMEKCLDSDPKKRPSSGELVTFFHNRMNRY